MRSHVFVVGSILAILNVAPAIAAQDCSLKSVPQPLPLRPTALPPLSAELPGSGRQLGSPDGVLAYASNETQAVDRVLLRLRFEGCQNVSQAAGYVPQTKWDNTPYRFNAGGNGKKFTAADFSAWMESKGIHVSKGTPQPMPVDAPQPMPVDAGVQPLSPVVK
jgi:hypothetical protein